MPKPINKYTTIYDSFDEDITCNVICIGQHSHILNTMVNSRNTAPMTHKMGENIRKSVYSQKIKNI